MQFFSARAEFEFTTDLSAVIVIFFFLCSGAYRIMILASSIMQYHLAIASVGTNKLIRGQGNRDHLSGCKLDHSYSESLNRPVLHVEKIK